MSTAFSALLLVAVYWNRIYNTLRRKNRDLTLEVISNAHVLQQFTFPDCQQNKQNGPATCHTNAMEYTHRFNTSTSKKALRHGLLKQTDLNY